MARPSWTFVIAAALAAGAGTTALRAQEADERPVARVTQSNPDRSAAAVRVSADTLLVGLELNRNDTLEVSFPVGQANGRTRGRAATVNGTVLAVDSENQLALVKADQAVLDRVGLATYRLAYDPPAYADPLTFFGDGTSTGELRAVLQSSKRLMLFDRDTVAITGDASPGGGPLINDCGELAGFLPAGEETAIRLTDTIQDLLDDAQVASSSATGHCEVAEDDGLTRLSDAEKESEDAARKAINALDTQIEELERRLAATDSPGAKADIEKQLVSLRVARKDYEDVEQKAKDLVETIESSRAAHTRDQYLLLAAPVVVLLLAVLGFVVFRRNRKDVTDREKSIAVLAVKSGQIDLELARQPWRDVVLSGPSGVLKVSASQLAIGGKGVQIGRNRTDCEVLFGPEDVSRVHARLFVRKDMLMLEDLGSSRGTFHNGRPLETKTPVPVSDGDSIRLASHEFELRIL
ncbi:MAG TPA: FHA domain-containing protein [Croceibacterium sp.]